MAGINRVGGTETSPFPSVDSLKKVDLTESIPSPSVERSKKEEEIESNPFPAVDALKKVDVTEIDSLPSVENSKKEPEIESGPSSSVDSLKKIDGKETAASPSIRRSKKVDADERDPFPSIYKLKKVEIKESSSFLPVSSAKKSDEQETNPFPVGQYSEKSRSTRKAIPFPPVDSMKKVDVKESAPLPVAVVMNEGEEQRESEIKILTEMFSTRDEAGRQTPTRLEAFLTIVRLEKHWGKTLDESSVSLLLENFSEHKQLFPYLASLPPLGTNQLRDFFLAVRNLDSLKSPDLALIVGDFQCFLKLLSLLYENGAIQESSVSLLLENLCQRFATVKTDAEFARSSFLVLDSLKKNLQYSLAAQDSEDRLIRASGDGTRPDLNPSVETTNHDIDELLFEAFAGPSNITRVKLDSEEIEVDLPGWKKKRMREVMALQAIPATDQLLIIFQQLDSLANEGQDPTSHLQSVDSLINNLRDVDETLWESVPKDLQLSMIQPHREKILRSLSALKISIGRGGSP